MNIILELSIYIVRNHVKFYFYYLFLIIFLKFNQGYLVENHLLFTIDFQT